jgi:hypothetical protein
MLSGMRALVVYESMFGDGRLIAQSIADGLATQGVDAEAVEVGAAPTTIDDDLDLLIVGGPNHGFGLSRPETRAEARQRSGGTVISNRIGIREWLTELSPNRGVARCVAWDTRLGYAGFHSELDTASQTIEQALQRAGFASAAKARHFLVMDVQGPLVDGEPDRARAWGRQLAEVG